MVLVLALPHATRGEADMDSLRAVWNDTSRPDTIRAQAIGSIMRMIFEGSGPDSASHYAKLQLAFAEKKGLRTQTGKALNMLGICYEDLGEKTKADSCYILAERLFEQLGDQRNLARVLNNRGNVAVSRGDLAHGVEYLTSGLRIAEALKDSSTVARTLGNIGIIYAEQGEYAQAMDFYHKRLVVAEAIGDKQCAGEAYTCMADAHKETGELQLALEEFTKSVAMAQEIGDERVAMMGLGSIGTVHLMLGDQKKAMEFLTRSLHMAEEQKDPMSISTGLATIGRSYFTQGRLSDALSYGTRALSVANEVGGASLIREAAELLYLVRKAMGDDSEALAMHELFITMRDSVLSAENQQEVMSQKFQYDYDKKEALLNAEQEKKDAVAAEELRRKNVQRNAFIGGFGLMVLLAGVFFVQRNRINKEKKRSEELLLNILPEEVADELKAKGSAEAVHIDQVTVLFTDFKGFTAMSEVVTPAQLVRDLNECFSAFDHITGKYGIEKIKTIGDAYMAAGGLPTPNTTHATDVIKAALEMRDFIAEGKAHKIAAGLPYFEIRIGMHTGPVVAGIVGVKKFQYDIWGDTVNTASRMESSGEVGQVNISEATYALVKGEAGLSFTPRGKVQAKGKGEMEMYFVRG
ncbi:MAG: adenylate/guanylate cyclase domain-containing protein [Flavobacteriales bacterium]